MSIRVFQIRYRSGVSLDDICKSLPVHNVVPNQLAAFPHVDAYCLTAMEAETMKDIFRSTLVVYNGIQLFLLGTVNITMREALQLCPTLCKPLYHVCSSSSSNSSQIFCATCMKSQRLSKRVHERHSDSCPKRRRSFSSIA